MSLKHTAVTILSLATAMTAGLVVLTSLAVSTSGATRGSETKGRAYYRQTCKGCHTKGAKGGEISPLTKTQAQWRTYLQKGTHMKGAEPLSKYLDEAKLADLQVFLVNHAADSPQPETCGK